MVCYSPKIIYQRRYYPIHIHSEEELKKYNKTSLAYKKGWQQIVVPCGHCDGCRMDKANEWATRIMNEFECWDNKGVFITLSYNNPNLPMTKERLTTLKPKDIVNFKKRLRKYAEKHQKPFREWTNPQTHKVERPIRTFECGEYGMNGTRAAIGGNPHYHMIVMNWMPNDLVFDKISKKSGLPVYKSETIEKLWGKGYCPIGFITYESASYVSRYTLKKNGLAKKERVYYDEQQPDGKMKRRWHTKEGKQKSEFITMSTMPGIGKQYFLNHFEEIKQNKHILIKANDNVKVRKVPRYYRKIWEKLDWQSYHRYKYDIQEEAQKNILREIEKYNLPKDWCFEKKINWISQQRIDNWRARKQALLKREVA